MGVSFALALLAGAGELALCGAVFIYCERRLAMAGHTPKPWEQKDWMVSNYPAVPLKVICYTANNQKSRTDENLANARLISAAPDLFEACKAFLYGQAEPRECEAMMRAAIAKAEGTHA